MPFNLFSQEYTVASILPELKENANMVIRSSITGITINQIDDMEIKKQEVFTVFNKAGEEQATVYIPYDKSRKVSEIKVQILDASGKVIKKYSKSDFADVSAVSAGTLYQDDRILILQHVSNSFPYSISYSYTTNTSNTVFLPDYFPFMQYKVSLENSQLNINNKSGVHLRTKEIPSDWTKIEKTISNEFFSYGFKNVKAIQKERWAPGLHVFLPRVEFSLNSFNYEGKRGELTSWNSFGNWVYTQLLSPVSIVTPELKAEVASLNLSGSVSDKVKKIYQYMQNKTRYVNVSIGIGGWMPMSPEEVRKKGYGDCKGLTNYMKTMLDAAGIPSYFCVITSDETPDFFDPQFPKMSGNHAILLVPTENGNIWLENTSQNIAFNHLSYNTTDRNVIAFKGNSTELINTPSYPSEENQEYIKTIVNINEDSSINVNSSFKYSKAQYDFNTRYLYLNQEDFKKEITEELGHLKLEGLQVNLPENNRDKAELSYKLNFKARDYSKKLGEDLFFRILPLHNSSTLQSTDERKLPLFLGFAYQDVYEVEFIIPEGYKVSSLPAPSLIKSEFGEYSLSINAVGGKITVIRKLTSNKGLFPKEKYKEFIEFRKKINNLDNTKLLISKSI